MSYEDAVAYLSSLQHRGWRLGLDRMEKLLANAGLTPFLGATAPQYLHVAGTNGKGSVTAYLQSVLVESGYRTGAFFSPYVVDLRERVQFGRELIPKDDFARIIAELAPVAKALEDTEFGGVTEFEMKMAVGVRYWSEQRCDYVALEVGLGGRLDATNVVTPAASGIVSIGYDHTAILGPTLGEIATEKAGIIKHGRPVVTGKLPEEAMAAVARRVAETESEWWRWGHELRLSGSGPYQVETPHGIIGGVTPSLVGVPQPHNMAVAIGMLMVSGASADPDAIRRGVASAILPGRFQQYRFAERDVILDGAHNGESAQFLVETLLRTMPGQQFTLITGMVDGHDIEPVMGPLWNVAARTLLVPIDFYRARPPESLIPHTVAPQVCESSEDALMLALTFPNPILVTGSFYLVGDVLRTLARLESVD